MRDDRNVQQSGPIGPRRIDDSAPDDDADDPAVSRLGAKHYSFDFTPRSTPPLPLARSLPPPPPPPPPPSTARAVSGPRPVARFPVGG